MQEIEQIPTNYCREELYPLDFANGDDADDLDIQEREILDMCVIGSNDQDSSVWRFPVVPIEEWVYGKEYLNLEGVVRRPVVEDIVDFFKTKSNNPWDRYYDEAVFCEGIGSGKSFKTSIIATYFIHIMLCMRSPQRYFGISESSKIAIMNMSISEKNAKKVIFSEIMEKIKTCNWFNRYPWDHPEARMPDPNCQSELRFKKNLYIIPGSSSWRTAVGYNILVGIVDEAGSYRNTDNGDQCEDIYLALQRRLGSRFADKGAIIMAGSPMYEQDFVEAKIKEADEENTRILARRRTLWDAKYYDYDGDYFYVDRINRIILEGKPSDMTDIDQIPHIPFLFKAFRANVTKAYRDFGGRPSPTINSFFEQPSIVLKRINRARNEDPVGARGDFKDWLKCLDPMAFHTIHIDLAISGDACGLCLGHFDSLTAEGGVRIYIDLFMRLVGSKEHPIQIAKVRDYIYALTEMGFPIQLITFDGFQSTDSIQILEKKGYIAEYLSVDRNALPYNNLKEAINENRVDYYSVSNNFSDEKSASEVLVRELMQLEDIEGKKVDHPPKGSKDVADAMCGVVHNIVTKYQDYHGVVKAKIL